MSFPHGCDQEYRLKVDCDGRIAKVYVDDQELFRVENDLVARGGKVGITADCPSRFADFKVCVSEKTKQEIDMAELAVKEAETEEMKKQFSLINRPSVSAEIVYLKRTFWMLRFNNNGNQVSYNTKIILDEDFINSVEDDYRGPLDELKK